jgi:hypothetical protein
LHSISLFFIRVPTVRRIEIGAASAERLAAKGCNDALDELLLLDCSPTPEKQHPPAGA